MRRVISRNLARVEGAGALTVEVDGNRVRDIKFEVLEGSRLFEPLVKGRSFNEVPSIVSRICAICSISHSLASTMAVEDAFDVKVSHRTAELRQLLHCGESLESHALHLFLLALPDFLGVDSAIELAGDHPAEVNLALSLKRLGNEIQETIGGRAIHPVNIRVGRFGRVPSRDVLSRILYEVEMAIDQLSQAVTLFLKISQPSIVKAGTTYLALRPVHGYGLSGRKVNVSDGTSVRAEDFATMCQEKVLPHSHAKHSSYRGNPFMVGALSRLVVNRDLLTGPALGVLHAVEGTHGPMDAGNPFNNNLAQLVEIAWSLDKAREILTRLVGEKPGSKVEDTPKIKTREAIGIGMVEAPRGILYHRYRFDREGKLKEADVITPTALNLANIERDMRLAASRMEELGGPEGAAGVMGALAGRDLRFLVEAIARAYDPCISCSVH